MLNEMVCRITLTCSEINHELTVLFHELLGSNVNIYIYLCMSKQYGRENPMESNNGDKGKEEASRSDKEQKKETSCARSATESKPAVGELLFGNQKEKENSCARSGSENKPAVGELLLGNKATAPNLHTAAGGHTGSSTTLPNGTNSTKTERPATIAHLLAPISKPQSAQSNSTQKKPAEAMGKPSGSKSEHKSAPTAPNIRGTADLPNSSNPPPAADFIIDPGRSSARSSSTSTPSNSRVQESSARAKDSSPSSPDDGHK